MVLEYMQKFFEYLQFVNHIIIADEHPCRSFHPLSQKQILTRWLQGRGLQWVNLTLKFRRDSQRSLERRVEEFDKNFTPLIHTSCEYIGMICILFISSGPSELYPFSYASLRGEGDLTSPSLYSDVNTEVYEIACSKLCKEQFPNYGRRMLNIIMRMWWFKSAFLGMQGLG